MLIQKIIERDVLIGTLDLKNKLTAKFGDKFKTTVEDPEGAETSQGAPANTS